jgi:hypothetical protein
MRSKCKRMKSAKSKAKTPSLKHSYKKDQMDPSVVEASADADASPEIAFPAVSGEALPPLAEVTKAMLAKVRRAFGKAG